MNELKKEKLRAYRVGEHDYPSVTTVLSYVFGLPPEMKKWLSRNASLAVARAQRLAAKEKRKITQKALVEIGIAEPERLLKLAQLKGTTVHKWAEEYYNSKAVPNDIPKDYQGYWNSFLRFNEYFKCTPILQEIVVSADDIKIAGRLDWYGTLLHQGQEKKIIIDFKTSNFLRSDYGLQLAAYKHCLEAMGYPVDECYILHLCSHGFYEFVKYNDDIEDFISVRRLFDWKKQREQPEFELAWTPTEAIEKLKTPG